MTESASLFSFDVTLPAGVVAVDALWDRADNPWGTLVLAHGAGAGMTHPWLAGFAEAAATLGLSTMRFTFPYLQSGRRMPGPATHAIAAWTAAMEVARADASPSAVVIAGGKSYGGRMASMAAATGVIDPSALLYLGYPLHPPGKPEKPRVEHLPDITAPQLFVSGTRDAFVDPHEQLEAAVASCQNASLQWVERGGHSFEVAGNKRDAATVGAELAPSVVAELRRILSL